MTIALILPSFHNNLQKIALQKIIINNNGNILIIDLNYFFNEVLESQKSERIYFHTRTNLLCIPYTN